MTFQTKKLPRKSSGKKLLRLALGLTRIVSKSSASIDEKLEEVESAFKQRQIDLEEMDLIGKDLWEEINL